MTVTENGVHLRTQKNAQTFWSRGLAMTSNMSGPTKQKKCSSSIGSSEATLIMTQVRLVDYLSPKKARWEEAAARSKSPSCSTTDFKYFCRLLWVLNIADASGRSGNFTLFVRRVVSGRASHERMRASRSWMESPRDMMFTTSALSGQNVRISCAKAWIFQSSGEK